MKKLLLLSTLLFGSIAQAAGPTTQAVNSPVQHLGNLTAKAVNLAATGDQATISIPSFVTAYVVTAIRLTNCSATPVLAPAYPLPGRRTHN